jgi:iron complex transport system substrate-binding protein
VDWAGGQEVFERLGLRSAPVRPEDVARAAPDVIVLAPCGFHVESVEHEATRTPFFEGWHELPAVRAGAVWAVDASSYYSRPGPRLVDGVEHMARILHPEIFGAPDPATARRITVPRNAPARG